MAKSSAPIVRNKFSPVQKKPAVVADDGRTQQHFKDQCDINILLAKYRKTGIMEHVTRAKERYGDFTQYGSDLAADLDRVAKAKQTFEMLPAELRNQFKNSIPGFFNFVQDPKNFDQCVKWGIYDKPQEVVAPPSQSKPDQKSSKKTDPPSEPQD